MMQKEVVKILGMQAIMLPTPSPALPPLLPMLLQDLVIPISMMLVWLLC